MGLDQQSYMHCKAWQQSGGKMCNMAASWTQKGRQAGIRTNDSACVTSIKGRPQQGHLFTVK